MLYQHLGDVALITDGFGIVMYSASELPFIAPESDFLGDHYYEEDQVQDLLHRGAMAGFGTGGSGDFTLRFLLGPPQEETVQAAEFKYRLAIVVSDGILCVRDLFALAYWDPECPPEQQLAVPNGTYRITLCADTPASGQLRREQQIEVYLEPVSEWPKLSRHGIPHLFP